jgi:hypothetical protein
MPVSDTRCSKDVSKVGCSHVTRPEGRDRARSLGARTSTGTEKASLGRVTHSQEQRVSKAHERGSGMNPTGTRA